MWKLRLKGAWPAAAHLRRLLPKIEPSSLHVEKKQAHKALAHRRTSVSIWCKTLAVRTLFLPVEMIFLKLLLFNRIVP